MGTVLASGALAFLLGGAGAWGYLNYLDPKLRQHSDTRQAQGQGSQAGSKAPDVGARVDELSGKLDQLQADVDRVSKTAAPTDLEPLNKRVTSLEDLPRKVEAMEARVSALAPKIDQEGRKVTALMADVEGVRTQVSGLRSEIPMKGIGEASAKSSKPAAPAGEPPREITPPARPSLQAGVDLFHQKKYHQAEDLFLSLTRSEPEDARNWYYAALAQGLATRDWKGETEKLVTEGVEREKAGKPAKAEIDSTFADLTPETGKDWLAFYRGRAR